MSIKEAIKTFYRQKYMATVTQERSESFDVTRN